MTVLDGLRRCTRTLDPGYFALVMATGIVSIGMQLHGLTTVSAALLLVSVVAYVVLLALTGWRLVRFRGEIRTDLTDASRAFGFFTFVAGSNVLGIRLTMDGWHSTAAVLLAGAAATWLVLGYVIPWTAVLGTRRRPVIAKANGSWFVWVVAAQSVALAAATLEPIYDDLRRPLSLVAVFAWSVGLFLYAAAGVFVAARMMQYPLRPVDLTPSYWVSMGAAAITVVAGSRIVAMESAPMVDATRGLVAGLVVVFWAFATWLLPALVAAGWWRHRTHRIRLRYEPGLWSIVFPLGMYGVAGVYLAEADELPWVGVVGRTELWVAVTVWAAVFAAMLVHLWRTVLRPRPATVGR
ncbi:MULTISPECIES: tellurite resistance/C4-dicarboxylate transporter family protein [Rhodococcus]|uniref:Tellurite resistance/C4-dicarboxylate transporter family protein n=1 Tax=Rhodococcus indonesiensis TaxID=3055869 RepID=A0ABT7RSP8_9NOCA|nr:tellurite resistance/C4-dicarboxylate transporter family protein [Rhodococcus indonesiensis]MDM7490650.1 tellurite resistance/C4-dicarboxylate transporter family protein [Rhodococcus indonesiensis]